LVITRTTRAAGDIRCAWTTEAESRVVCMFSISETKQQELMTWKTGEAYVFQPDIQLHNGFNNNPGERTTLLIDFYKESLYTKEKFEAYYQHYSECFEGLENLVDVYESRKQEK
jgi:hypothetical protein